MPIGHVSIGVEVQRNADGDTPSTCKHDNALVSMKINFVEILLVLDCIVPMLRRLLWSPLSLRQQCLNIFSSGTARLIKAKLQMETPWGRGLKVYINGPSHMT